MRVLLFVSCMAAAASACAAAGAGGYPSRPIRVVVTFPPGGPTDIIARAVAQKLSDSFGQPVVVDNRAGAGGNIGMDIVAKAPPDGYTIVESSFGPLVISPFVYSKLPYDPVKDLTPITLAAASWFFLAVHPSVPARSVKELIAAAKAKPGGYLFASAGNATPSHLAGALFQAVAGIQLTHVPYKGSATSLPALIAGEAQIAIESPPLLVPQVKAGKLRGLAAARPGRSPLLPDVPTMKESGLSGMEVGSWYGFHAPAGTPKAIVDRLHAEMVKAMNAPDVRERFAGVGADTIADSPAEFAAFISAELKKWGTVIRAAGVKLE
ncbi:MAG TPA: tripartite tricarboxylate transporter substrate binding protein [Burkholderiales bacterium]|nr:tripartite tricarboxylate transporter substrate binding protein [Burkholderiales bacterium]